MNLDIQKELKESFDINVTTTDAVALFNDVDKFAETEEDAKKLHSLLKAFSSMDQILNQVDTKEDMDESSN